MNKQAGFTLIELMIVVAIIAILAAIAINQYQDYVIRAQLAEGSSLADGVKSNVGEFYTSHGAFPSTNNSSFLAQSGSITGQYVAGLNVGTIPGQIELTMGRKSTAALTNKTLIFSAITTAGSITWHCLSTNLKQRWCPSSCACSG